MFGSFFSSSSQFIYIQNPMNYNIPAEGDHQAGAIWSRELLGRASSSDVSEGKGEVSLAE